MATSTIKKPFDRQDMQTVSHVLVATGATIEANSYLAGSVQIEKSGYYPVGIVGWSTSGSGANQAYISIPRCRLSSVTTGSAQIDYVMSNLKSADLTGMGLTAYVLWIKV